MSSSSSPNASSCALPGTNVVAVPVSQTNDVSSATTEASYCICFNPSEVLSQETLANIQAVLGLSLKIPSGRFKHILDKKLTVPVSFVTTAEGFHYIGSPTFEEATGGAQNYNEGPTYEVKLHQLEEAIRSILLSHVSKNFTAAYKTKEAFLRYQIELERETSSNGLCAGATSELSFILPSKEQLMDLYHDLYELPALTSTSAEAENC